MKRRVFSSVLVLLATCLWFLQTGYVVQTRLDRIHTDWDPARYPIVIRPSISLAQSLRFEAGSQPLVALREALERWVRVSSLVVLLGEESSRRDAGRDDVNLVTIADSDVNRNLVGSALGTSVRWTSGARITETDVIFNPEQTWSTRETDDFRVKNFLDVGLHELGHSWNLGHSISRASTLYFRTQGFNWGFNRLAQDDRSGIQTSYPLVGLKEITGNISGRVTRNGDPVFGAFVVAVDESGVLSANAITLPDGGYRIQNIPPGRYTLYVEPLDGPMTPQAVRGGIFDAPPSMVTDFPSQFYQNSREPRVRVASEVTGVDFEVGRGAIAGPEFVGTSSDAFSASFATTPAEALQGSNTHYVVAGQGVDGLPEEQAIFFLGNHLKTGSLVAQAVSTDGNPVKWYPLTVPSDTPLGEYTAFLQTEQAFGVITGGLRVVPRLRFGLAFAQFAHIPGTAVSKLFLVNVDRDAPTRDTISARASNGDRRVVRMNPEGVAVGTVLDQELALQPGGSAAIQTSGGDLFIGSLRTRANGCVGGTVLFQTPFGTTGVGPSIPLFTVVAPIDIRSGQLVNTGLAITNLNSQPVQIYLGVQNKAGIRQGHNVITLPGNGQISRFIREERDDESLISRLPDNLQGTVVVTANREIGVTVIRTAEGVFTTFPAVQGRVRRSSHFAQFVHSGSLRSSLLLVNPSGVASANVTVQVRQSSGSQAAVTLNREHLANGRKTFVLPPLGSEILETHGRAEVIGSVEVSSDVPVGGVVLFSSPKAGTTGVGESFPMSRMVVPVSRELGMDTGVAVVNTEDRSVKLDLVIRNSRGEIAAGPLTLTLKPREQKARFPSELGFQLGPSFTGSLWIEADGLVAATAIRQSPGILTTFPVIGLEKAITPAPR